MNKLSVIIPAKNEIYLEKTILNILDNAGGDIEVIVVLDAWIPDPQIDLKDDRVKFLYFKDGVGQRKGINEGAKIATGNYFMKADAHCAFDKDFDLKLIADCEYKWTVIPRMYNLDIETWKPKLRKVTDYMYISGPKAEKPFRSMYYTGSEYRSKQRQSTLIDDTMGCMGPCFFMHMARFWELGGCDEGHEGGWGQQGIEVALKAWLSGGALKVNKKTWFAHWFRGGGGPGFPYPISGRQVENVRKYSQDLWLNNKWPLQTRKIEWLVQKFKPDGWDIPSIECHNQPMQEFFYRQIHLKRNSPFWRGVRILKMPTDICLYQMAIQEKKPDVIIEIGTAECGSALFFADMLALNGKGIVISIDPNPRGELVKHDRIIYIQGDSKDAVTIEQVKEIISQVPNASVMLSIDGLHKRRQVKWELMKYRDIVTSGQYIVVEDCYDRHGKLTGPGQARDWFLGWNKRYKKTNYGVSWLFGMTMEGWLLKK